MVGLFKRIQLVGGPDDGAVFSTPDLPAVWTMMKQSGSLAAVLQDEDGVLHDEDRYYKTAKVNRLGHYLYYHEGFTDIDLVSA